MVSKMIVLYIHIHNILLPYYFDIKNYPSGYHRVNIQNCERLLKILRFDILYLLLFKVSSC